MTMALNQGSQERLSTALADRYLIEREIGSGGMATVYLAQDLKHDRKVAVKVLKPELAAVVGTERFLAEIRTTANLAHPHILPLHDSGEADGFLYYVMPHVEGESLAERLDRDGQLPVEEAVRIAGHVADALDYAHHQGVIHRDIKPGNILFQAGDPVVADFGIALAVTAAGEGRLTETGLSLGTPFYMSPEQAAGDQRPTAASDVYSLGCVLYEMLTGDPPHTGSSAQAILGKILLGEVTRPTKLRRTIPANVEGALLKALERLPADRFETAAGIAAALKDPYFRHGGAATESGTSPLWKAAVLALFFLAIGLALVTGWALQRSPDPRTPIRVQVPLDPPRSTGLGGGQATISPDGSFMVYEGEASGRGPRLWLHSFRDMTTTPVLGTEGESDVRFSISPDGREVAYISNAPPSSLQVVSLQGGAPRTVVEGAVCCPLWGRDGFIYYTSLIAEHDLIGTTVSRVSASGGEPEQVAEAGDRGIFLIPTGMTRDGRVLLFLSFGTGAEMNLEIRARRLADGKETVLLPGGVGAAELPTGHLALVNAGGWLEVAPFDPEALEITGPTEALVPELIRGGDVVAGGAIVSLSETGTLLYVHRSGAGEYQPVWVDRGGASTPVDPSWSVTPGMASMYRGFSLSPDGTMVAMGVWGGGGYQDHSIRIKRLPDGAFSLLATTQESQARPSWAPDGRSVTFISATEDGNWGLVTRSVDRVALGRQLLDQDYSIWQAVWAPDSSALALRVDPVHLILGNTCDIGVWEFGTDSVRVMATDSDEGSLALSPDGRWLAYESNESGRWEVYVQSFPDLEVKYPISSGGGRMPVWGRSGTELFYVNGSREMMAVEVTLGDEFEVGERRALFYVDPDILVPEGENMQLYDVDVDDQRFMMLRALESGEEEVVMVIDWLEEVKRVMEGGR